MGIYVKNNMTEPTMQVFKNNFSDEMKDANNYLDLAMQNEAAGNDKVAKGLYLMGKDEYTHARFIYCNLIEHCDAMPKEQMVEWNNLNCRIHSLFGEIPY